MNILVVGGGSWDDTSSLGNTFSNLFSGWDNVNFYNLYFRDTMPNNMVCRNYYKITTKEILKKYFSSSKIGESFQFYSSNSREDNELGVKEKKIISLIHRLNLNMAYELEDRLWYTEKWKNKKLDEFIERVNPDVIFSFAAGNSYMYLPIEYIKSKTNAKLVLLVADDMHTTYRLKNDKHHLRMRNDLDRLMGLADRVYGISQEMCAYYNELYGVEVLPLYKGCVFENNTMSKINNPVRIVYAGNLLFGRLDTLYILIDVLRRLNEDGVNTVVDIYSSTLLTEAQKHRLNCDGVSRFHGMISYSEVKRTLADSDIVLHVESFEEEQIEKVRYSFSTKIIDCLQSGSVMLAVGPAGISSIEYPRTIPGVIIVDKLDEMYATIKQCLTNNDLIDRASRIREFAIKRHSADHVRNALRQDFENLIATSR